MPIYNDKKTGRLYIEFQYKNHRHKERLPIGTSKDDAKRIEVKLKNDLMFQSHGIETDRQVITFKHFIESTFGPVADSYPKDRYDRTVLLVKAAYAFFRDKPMRSIKAADIERLKASRVNLTTMHGTPRTQHERLSVRPARPANESNRKRRVPKRVRSGSQNPRVGGSTPSLATIE